MFCARMLKYLKNRNVEVRPICGKAMSCWYEATKALRIPAGKQWFVCNVKSLSGIRISSREEWDQLFDEKILPIACYRSKIKTLENTFLLHSLYNSSIFLMDLSTGLIKVVKVSGKYFFHSLSGSL
ncbi:MAG: hypothetical protein QXW58_03030 [Thermosphaera sp.]